MRSLLNLLWAVGLDPEVLDTVFWIAVAALVLVMAVTVSHAEVL